MTGICNIFDDYHGFNIKQIYKVKDNFYSIFKDFHSIPCLGLEAVHLEFVCSGRAWFFGMQSQDYAGMKIGF